MKSKGKEPIFSMPVNGKYIIAIYQGSLSQFDILIKYRQLIENKWSRIRTPKHIHWTVDILIKLYQDEINTKKFIDILISMWNDSKPIQTKEEFYSLNLEKLYEENKSTIENFKQLGLKGEYSIGFLILLAKLLMVQEKTNRNNAYMFGQILEKLKNGNKELFSLISTSTHNGR